MSKLSLSTNVTALAAQRQFGRATSELETIFTRLSSGKRINRASDDAAGLAISEKLNADARVFAAGIKNINDGVSLLNTSESALSALSTLTMRQLELAEQAANGVYSHKQRQAIELESKALVREYNRIVESSSFNGIKLLSYSETPDTLSIQAGYGLDGRVTHNMNDSLERTIGNGTFSGTTSISAVEWGRDVELADLNGDGRLDAVIGGQPSSGNVRISVGFGNGSGGFTGTTHYSYSGNQDNLDLADVNGDGMTDLISAGGGLNVRLATSPGVFAAETTYSMVSDDVEVEDINNDGYKDLLSVGVNDTLQTRLGLGNGLFGGATTYTLPEDLSSNNMSTGDMNNDGYVDVIVTGILSNDSRIYTYLNDGAGNFSRAAVMTVYNQQVNDSKVADMNVDGTLDVVAVGSVAGSYSGNVLVYRGNGDGTISSSARTIAHSTGQYFQDVAVSDLNGDGIPDIIAAGDNGSSAALIATSLTTSENLTFSAFSDVLTGGTRNFGVAVGDLNRDGAPDIVSAGLHANNKSVLANTTKTNKMALFSLSTKEVAREALMSFTEQLNRINSELGRVGAAQSRFQTATNNLRVQRENYLEAGSRIADADIADETSKLIRQNILQQSSARMASLSSAQTKLILSLLSD